MHIKFIKFILVGFTGLIIDFSITWFLKEKLRANQYLANSMGFSVAATTNYMLNRLWTFNSQNEQVLIEFGSFIAIALVGLVINNSFLYLFEKRFPFYVSKFLAILVTTSWNFIANYMYTFR